MTPRMGDLSPSTSTRGRWYRRPGALAAAAATVSVALGALYVVRARDRAPTRTTASASEMKGMSGMGDMNMSSDGSVQLTASQLRQFGVTFGTVEQRTLTNEVRTVGTVTADETRLATVTSKIGGYVERLYVNTTGQPVRRGQPLAAIYSPELLAAQQELLLARGLDRTMGESAVPGVPNGAGGLLAAARQRLRLWDVSDAQINELLRTGRPSRTITLYAPVSGVVTEKQVVQGQAIQAGMPLYGVTDLSTVWVNVQLREGDASLVREGMVADLEFTGLPGRPYKGRVTYVYPTVGETTRTLAARVVVSNSDGQLKPGMYATARLASPGRTALTVPRAAVVQTGERALVFVDMGNGQLMPHDVELGRTVGEYAEVLAGVEPGQRVVTSAQFLLESESNLAEVMKSMIGMGGSGGAMNDMKGMEMQGADTRAMPGAASAAPGARGTAPATGPR